MADRDSADRATQNQAPGQSEAPAEETAGSGSMQAAMHRRYVQRKATKAEPPKGPDAIATQAIREKGDGAPLPSSAQAHFGQAYGQDLSGVRVHTDSKAAAAADGAGAEAFTYGKDVFFGSGRFKPQDEHGKFVLAHELAHVAQQGHSAPQVKHKKVGVGGEGDAHEAQADEAAHDALETGHSGDEHEHEASGAADRALSGQRSAVGRAPGRIRFFAQGDGSKLRGGHSYMTERALAGMGISDQASRDPQTGAAGQPDTRIARMGNWERDLSQVLTPTTAGFVKEIMPMLNVIAIKDFGRGINASSFGTYDPVEHIDNPTDLRGSDVLSQGAMVSSGNPSNDPTQIAAQANNPDNAASIAGKHGAGTMGGTAGRSDQAYADVDKRYGQENGHKQNGKIMNPQDAAAFQVDESGIPRYMYASKEWLTQTLRTSARLGRQQKVQGDEHLHGPRLFASGTHTLQDFFAHSNFMEIGLNILIRQGGLKIADGAPAGKDGQVHTVDADAARGGRVLNTQAHANDAHGNPLAGNLAIGDPTQGGQGQQGQREVLTTGSFNLTDTVDSLLEEVGDHWKMLDPFKKKEDKPSELTLACLDYMDMDKNNPTDFSGTANTIADLIHGGVADLQKLATAGETVIEGAGHATGAVVSGAGHATGAVVEGAGHATGAIVEGAGHATGAVVSAAGTAGGGIMSGLGHAAEWLGGHMGNNSVAQAVSGAGQSMDQSGQQLAQSGHQTGANIAASSDKTGANIAAASDKTGANIAGAADQKAAAIKGGADSTAAAIQAAVAKLGGFEKEWRGRQHTAKGLYQWMYAHGPLDELQAMLRPIPKVGPAAAGKVHDMQQEMHRMVNGMLATAWNHTLDAGVNALNKVIGKVREKTNIQTKKTPAGGKGPVHAAEQFVAGKFGNVSDMYDQSTGMPKQNAETGTMNGIAPGSYTPPSHTEVAKDHGEIDNDAAKNLTHGAEDTKEEQGNWLSPIAQVLASSATEQVGVPVSQCWDVVDAGGTIGASDKRLDKIDQKVDEFFRHPADCDFWRAPLRAAVGSRDLGPSLLAHLQSARATAPENPSHVPQIPANHPANKSETDDSPRVAAAGGKPNS